MHTYKMIFTLLIWTSLLFEQSNDHTFQNLLENFENEYAQLTIPNLELSYVSNLENIRSKKELNAQKKFFEKYQIRLREIDTHELSDQSMLDYQVLNYEIDLNLERIALESQWKEGDYSIRGSRLYDETLGKAWYAYFLKKWVDSELTPDKAYAFGLEEVEKVKLRRADIRKRIEAKGSDFDTEWANEEFIISDKAEVQEQYDALLDKVKKSAQRIFPDVDQIPSVHIEAGTNRNMAIAPAYYTGNTFYYNFFEDTYDSRDMGWIFLHEAIPGHHYQHHIAAQADVSIRQLFYYMGYIEGWGAYIEQFGRALGAYETPFDTYAMLNWDLIRSVRVVLDVGLNYYGWSDEEAMTFWNKHIENKEDIARREIKRMKQWPAQVITYKYGKAVLDELKGDKNTADELMAFHRAVLKNGSLPVSVLRNHIQKKENQRLEKEARYLPRTTTIDQTIGSLYAVISGNKGEERDWDFLRYLFHPEARFAATGKRQDGSHGVRYVTLDEYIESSGAWMLENGFFEKEMQREVQKFGPIAQVFSSYECFHSKEDTEPFMRGINSIQLMYTGERWQVINIYFTQETEDNPIPEAFEKG